MSAWRTRLRRFLPRRFLRSGTLHSLHDVWSPELGNRREVVVYLPPTYGRSRRFPVVYMQDGQNLFDPATAHAGDWALLRALDALAAAGHETIIVGVWNAGEARIAEYSPFRDEKTGGGRGDLYLAFLIETLKPMIDRRFRTRPERAHTGIAGSSMGGLISLYGFFRAPAVFGFAGVLSPSLWYADAAIFPVVAAAPVAPTAGELLADADAGKKIIKAKGAKNIASGIANILATFNNTIVAITDMQGNILGWSSAGRVGFKGSRKSTAFAAQQVAQDAARQAMSHGMKEVEVKVKGPGSGRESAIRALQAIGLEISSIKDVTPIPHNGCRPRKKRRV